MGAIAGRVGSFVDFREKPLKWFLESFQGETPERAQELAQQASDLASQLSDLETLITVQRTGAQFSIQELERYKLFLADIRNNPKVALRRVRRIRNENLRLRTSATASTQGRVQPGVIKQMIQEIENFQPLPSIEDQFGADPFSATGQTEQAAPTTLPGGAKYVGDIPE